MGWSLYRKNYRKPRSVIVPTHVIWSHGYRKTGVGKDREKSRLGNMKQGT